MRLVLMQMAALIACGVISRCFKPPDMDIDSARRVITGLVYTLLLLALVLLVLWRAPLTWDALRIAAAAAFPNVTYLGLPVLEKTFGPWARSVAIQYDLFACTPLLLTLVILLVQTHGTRDRPEPLLIDLFK